MIPRPPLFLSLVAAILAFVLPAGLASVHHGGRDYGAADRAIGVMESAIACLVRGYPLEIRGVRPSDSQRDFSRSLGYIDRAIDELRDAFDNHRGFSRIYSEFNQLENRFKTATRSFERARVSPATKRHFEALGEAIADFKRLKSSQFGSG